jgi:tRNA threonylcarbamoyladenosine biosynthesis protein TsaE
MSSQVFEITSTSVEQTIELGRKLGKQFQGGEIIALIGQLGTGKTHLIKGIALGLEVTNHDAVTSPTFTLINEYEGRLPLYHIDAYRLDSASQLEAIGFDEICSPPMIVVVEWADRVQALIESYNPIWIHLEHRGETERQIKISNLPATISL